MLHGPQAPATHDYQARCELLGEVEDLVCSRPPPRMGLNNPPAPVLDTLRLLVEQVTGFLERTVEHVGIDLRCYPGVGVAGELRQHVDEV